MSNWVPSISEDGDSTTSQGNLFQSHSKEVFLMLKWNFFYFNLCPLSIHQIWVRLAVPSLHPSIKYICILTRSVTMCSSTLFVFILFTKFSHKVFLHENSWWQEFQFNEKFKLTKIATKANTENLTCLLFSSSYLCS